MESTMLTQAPRHCASRKLVVGTVLTLLLSATAAAAAEPQKDQTPPASTVVSRKPVGAWTIVAVARVNQTGFCGAERALPATDAQAAPLVFSFIKQGKHYALNMQSPAWQLTPKSSFPVALAAAGVNADARAVAITANIVSIGLGDDRPLMTRLEAAPALDIKTVNATFRLPLDEFAAAHAELEACSAAFERTASNPFSVSAVQPASTPVRATSSGTLIEEATFLTIRNGDKSYRLEVMIVRPAKAGGRLPIALITHGKPSTVDMPKVRAETMLPQARDLAHRGWLAVAVVRRGYGRSDGEPGVPVSARFTTCATPDLRQAFDAEAEDLEAALRVVAERPDADGSRAIAIGVSAGGGTVLALAARQPKGLVAVVNVSGGLRMTRADGRLCGGEEVSTSAMKAFGASTRIPTLWLYAENDSLFGPELVRAMREAYAAGGGQADLRMFGALPGDGHSLFSAPDGRVKWLAALDQMLRAQGLPTWSPAAVSAAMKAARIAETRRPLVEQYFSAFTPKVLVMAPSGKWLTWSANTADIALARAKALADCKEKSGEDCVAAMENFDLVARPVATASAPATDGKR
jgi:dienelactone hydrolase